MRRLAFNSLVLSAGSYFAAIASLITYLLAARGLGPSAFGLLSGGIGVVVLVAGLADFGVNGLTTRALARDPTGTEPFGQTLSAKVTLAILLAAAWIGLSVAVIHGSQLMVPVAILGGYLLSLVLAGTLTVPFRAAENMTVVSVVAAVEKGVALAVSVALQRDGYRPEILPIALVVGGLTSVLVAALFMPRRFLTPVAPSLRTIVDLWRASYSFGLVGASAQILRSDVALVGVAAGSYTAGVYAAPSRLTTFLTVIPVSFSAAVFPRLVRSSGGQGSRRPELISAGAMLVAMSVLLGSIAFAAPFVVPLVLGSAYSSSVEVVRIFLVAIFVNAANLPLLAYLLAGGHERYAGRVVVTTVVIGLAGIALGARLGGAAGAAVGAVLLQLFQLILFGQRVLRHSPEAAQATALSNLSSGEEQQILFSAELDDAVRP